jgi:Flp pilus assembly protein TadG
VAVEAAIVLTVIVIPLTFTVISYAYMFSFRQALSQAASEGARSAVGASTTLTCAGTDPTTYTAATCPAQYAAVQQIQAALSNYKQNDQPLTCHDPSVASPTSLTCSVSAPTTTGCSTGHSCITVIVSFPYRDHPMIPSIPFTGWTLPPDLSFKSVVEVS